LPTVVGCREKVRIDIILVSKKIRGIVG